MNEGAKNNDENDTIDRRRSTQGNREERVDNEDAAGDQCEPGLQEGLKMCRYVSEQLSRELQKWQKKFDNTRQTNSTLKQNVVDLENEKQRILLKFEEDCRQFEILNTHVTKLEEKIETIRRFLENISVLEGDIKNSKIIEQKVIGNVIDTLDELCEDETFLAVENSLQDEMNGLRKKIEEIVNITKKVENYSTVESELDDGIVASDEKIANLKACLATSNDLSSIRSNIDEIGIEINAEIGKAKEKHQNLKSQIKLEIDSIRSQVQFFRERIMSECVAKNATINEWNMKCTKLRNSRECLDAEVMKINFRIEVLIEEKRKIRDELDAFRSKNESLKNELNVRGESLHSNLKKIQKLESELQVCIKAENELKKAKIEKENLKKKLFESGNAASLCKTLEYLRDTRKTNAEKIRQLKNNISNLAAKKNEEQKTLELTSDEIHREENEIKELKNLTCEMKFEDIVDGGKEFTQLNDNLKVEAGKNSLLKTSEAEIDSLRAKKESSRSKYENCTIEFARINQENDLLGNEIMEKEKALKILKDDREFYNNTIRKIKRNVLQHNYVTMQDLNNKLKTMVNSKNVESERVVKLKEEIEELKQKVDLKKKKTQGMRRLHPVEDNKSAKIQKIKPSK